MPVSITRLDWNGVPVRILVPTDQEWREDADTYHRGVYRLFGAVVAHAVHDAKRGYASASAFLQELRTWVSPRTARFLLRACPALDTLRSRTAPRAPLMMPRHVAREGKPGKPLSAESSAFLQTLYTGKPLIVPLRGRHPQTFRSSLRKLAGRYALQLHYEVQSLEQVRAWVTPLPMLPEPKDKP